MAIEFGDAQPVRADDNNVSPHAHAHPSKPPSHPTRQRRTLIHFSPRSQPPPLGGHRPAAAWSSSPPIACTSTAWISPRRRHLSFPSKSAASPAAAATREGGEETKKMTTMRRWGEEVVSLSLRGHGYGDEDDDRPEKPRRYGVTEMRSPIYSFRPTHDALQEILGSLGPFVDGLKFSGGSHSLMGKELVREITDLAHKHDIYVSTGDWAEHLLRQGPSTFKQYVEECRALGFDTIELNAGSLKLPEEALLRLVHLIKNSGLRAKPLFSVKFDSPDIPASGDRAFGAYMAPVKHNSERVDNVDLLIRRAERCLEAGAYMVMIDADDVCQRTDSLRADIIAKIVGRLGLEKTMFEASNANTSEWFVRRYGPRVNLFVDHSEVMNLERLRGFNMRRSNPSLLASPFFLNIQHRRRAKETWCKSKMGSTGGGSPDKESAPVCVTGATGYVGSWLIRTLLRRGYRVHATARDLGKAWQVLSAVEGKERLRMFQTDMGEEGSFDEAVRGCVALFHVAASMELHVSPDQHNVEEHVRSYVLEPATRGTINVLQSCIRAGTIRRVVFTSSISTMTATGADGQQKAVVDESCLRALDDVWGTKPIGWIYILSKRLTEAAAFRFAQEEGIHLVSVVIPTTAGPFLTPSVPTSIQLLLSPITGDPKLYSLLVSVHARFGSIPFAHIQDVCDAHVFLMETAQAEGRYLCARGSYPMAQIAQLLSSHYPPFKPAESQATQLKLSKDFDASNSSVVSSKRLTDLGFKFEHDVRDIVKDSVAQCVDHGFLDDPDNRSN